MKTFIPALLLVGAVCGSAVASTEVPCPESAAHSDALHAMLESDEKNTGLIRTVEGTDSVSQAPLAESSADDRTEESSDVAESPANEPAAPELTTRLPGVSANDMPRFRRHMFRTDI